MSEQWRLTVETPSAKPGEPDAAQRLRRLLKALLRSYNLRCISIERVAPAILDKPAEGRQ